MAESPHPFPKLVGSPYLQTTAQLILGTLQRHLGSDCSKRLQMDLNPVIARQKGMSLEGLLVFTKHILNWV